VALVTLIVDMADGTISQLNRGRAVLTPSVFLTGSAGNPDIPQAPIGAQFAGSTYPQVSLLPTDSPNVSPAGWGWDISFVVVPGNPAGWSFFLPAGPAAFAATDASPCVFTWTPPGSEPWQLQSLPDSTGIQLPASFGGFEANQTYYVVGASGLTFSLAATAGGEPLASSASGSGTLTVVSYNLSSLSPVSDVATMAAYMPLPSGGMPSAGWMPIASGVDDATVWGLPSFDIDG
jgi:hypothetical protein